MNEQDRRDQCGRPTWGNVGERPGAPRATDQLADQGVTRRRPPAAATAQAVQSWVDQSIAQAERQGAFDDLPGAGRPLRDVDVGTDPDWWVKGLVEREQLDLSGALPGPMQLRREKAGFPGSLLDLPDEASVRARLDDFNARVLADRRRPHAGPQSPPVVGRVDVEELVASWRTLRAERAAAASTPSPGQASDALSGGTPISSEPGTATTRRPTWWRRLQPGPRRARSQ